MVLPRASCQTGSTSTGLITDSSIARALEKSSGLLQWWRPFNHVCLCSCQFGCRYGEGMVLSNCARLKRSVEMVMILFPCMVPFHRNSLRLVKLNLWDRKRRLSLSSLCWCLFKARISVEYWFTYCLYPPSIPRKIGKHKKCIQSGKSKGCSQILITLMWFRKSKNICSAYCFG